MMAAVASGVMTFSAFLMRSYAKKQQQKSSIAQQASK
jgi:hypothetical protein